MAHPNLEHAVAFGRGEVFDTIKEFRVAARPNLGVAKLTMVRVGDLPPKMHRHGLHAVANAQHRNTLRKCGWRDFQGIFIVRRQMAARQNNAF